MRTLGKALTRMPAYRTPLMPLCSKIGVYKLWYRDSLSTGHLAIDIQDMLRFHLDYEADRPVGLSSAQDYYMSCQSTSARCNLIYGVVRWLQAPRRRPRSNHVVRRNVVFIKDWDWGDPLPRIEPLPPSTVDTAHSQRVVCGS
jgi:hypothetical protein